MATMLAWARGQFTDQTGSNSWRWFNALGWFSMRSDRISASDLINATSRPSPGRLRADLARWASRWNLETCNRCQCPGPDCP